MPQLSITLLATNTTPPIISIALPGPRSAHKMRDSAINRNKRSRKPKRAVARKKATGKGRGRTPKIESLAYWSGNSAPILRRLAQNLMGKERKHADKKE